MSVIRVGEMFCGIGGFRLGLEGLDGAHQGEHQETCSGRADGMDSRRDVEQAGYRVVWANEINRHACEVYRSHWNDGTIREGDIREVKTDDIPDIDFLCAGFPCQTFSYAGQRAGTGESRGTLFAQIVRVASAKRPKLLLLENVRGLLSSGDGRDFAIILRVLGGLGYVLQWECLNSKHFGVPQSRERVFVVGHLGAHRFRQVFPLGEDDCVSRAPPETPRGEGQRLWGAGLSGDGERRGEEEAVADTVNSRYYKGGPENLIMQIKRHRAGGDHMIRTYEGTAPTLTSQMGTGGNNVPLVAKPTRVVDGTGAAPGRTIRRFTPVEVERLQGFPDNWTAEGLNNNGVRVPESDTTRYKLVGNAVTVNVVRYVGRLLA